MYLYEHYIIRNVNEKGPAFFVLNNATYKFVGSFLVTVMNVGDRKLCSSKSTVTNKYIGKGNYY